MAMAGRQAGDGLHVRLLHLVQELAGVGGEALDVAPLALGVEGVEGQAALAGAGGPGDHDQAVAGQVAVHPLQVVDPGAPDRDRLVPGWLTGPWPKRSFYQAPRPSRGRLAPGRPPWYSSRLGPRSFREEWPPMTAKKPAPAVDRRSQQAIELFEKAMQGARQARLRARRASIFDALHRRPSPRSATSWSAPGPTGRCASGRCEKRPAFRPKTFEEIAPPRRVPAQPGRVRGGAQVPAPGGRDPPAQRARALLPGGHRRARGRHRHRPQGAAPGRRRRPVQPRPGAAATPTSTPSARTRSSSRSCTPRRAA